MPTFLTKLTQPKLWTGYPFLLSAVIGDIEDEITIVVYGYNSQGSTTGWVFSDGTSRTNTVVHYNITEIASNLISGGASYLTVYLESGVETGAFPTVFNNGEILTDTIRIDIVEACYNPIYLMGRNSLGGVLQWMFDVNQEYNFNVDNGAKAKRLLLTTTNLTINEWESINEFITLGEVYKNNIVEFSSSIIKTSSRIGQQVYEVDDDGNKTGVIALPTANPTLTRQRKHKFDLDIEYPEKFAV